MKHDPAASPPPDQIALTLVVSNIAKSTKVSKRESRGLPTIKANYWIRRVFEQRFVDCHVHRGAVRCVVVIDIQRDKNRHSEQGRGIPWHCLKGYNTGCFDFARHDN